MTEREAIAELRRRAYRTTCYGNKVLEHEENLVAIEALEKQIPKKPDFTEDKEFALCPCCNGKGLLNKQKYCANCGQKLDWSDT